MHLYNPPEPTRQDPHQGTRNWKHSSACGHCQAVPPAWLLRLPKPIPLHLHPINGGFDEEAESDLIILNRLNPTFVTWSWPQAPGGECVWWEIDRPPFVGYHLIRDVDWELRYNHYPSGDFSGTPPQARFRLVPTGDAKRGNLFRCLRPNAFLHIAGIPPFIELDEKFFGPLTIEPYWQYGRARDPGFVFDNPLEF